MTIYKIVGWVGLLVAIVAAFVTFPYATPLLAILGAIVGVKILAEHHVRVIASAIALHLLAGSFDGIPSIGPYLTAIIGNFGVTAAGAALVIIARNVYDRFKPLILRFGLEGHRPLQSPSPGRCPLSAPFRRGPRAASN